MTTWAALTAVLGALCGLADAARYEARVTPGPRSFTIESPRLSATVQDGMVVAVKSLVSGETHAGRDLADYTVPRGLGHLTGDAAAAAALHVPWGTRTMNQELAPGTAFPTVHHPHPESAYEATRTDVGIRATWTGLTNGAQLFPEETLTVEFWVDPDTGQLLFRASATSNEAGVYGVQIPVANLHDGHRLYVPSFGGVMYDSDMTPALTTLAHAPFWEAPVIGIEGREGSLGLWVEDEQLHPNVCFLNWSGRSFGVAIEHLNLMPFEPHKQVQSVTYHLDAFSGGWVDAMTPYREWYAKAYAPEIAARDAVKWADRIRIIIDHYEHSDEAYQEVADTFDPATVMYHEWNARAPQFDRDHPDMTPREGYAARVRDLHRYGFRVMAYVNTYCVNYDSPAFRRDGLAEFTVARKIRSFWKYLMPPVTFDTLEEGQLVYLDPLSARWRAYHTDLMITWKNQTDTDANYEDTAGLSGDFGNGVIDGKFGAQGSVAQFRELLRRNPAVPMAAEYGTDSIAFAVRWPLHIQQVWGNDRTREFWMEHMRPVCAYLFGPGHRPWVPIIRAESNFLRHVVMACSDALGGIAQYPGHVTDLHPTRGVMLQMKQRAQLFAEKQLAPYFPRQRWQEHLACTYQDSEGQIYEYYADQHLQRMVGPDGSPLYERIAGRSIVLTDLVLPGWPAAAEGRLFGLDPGGRARPRVRYALVPGTRDPTKVQLTDLPENVMVSRFYETEDFTVLGLAPIAAEGSDPGEATLIANARFAQVLLNDSPAADPQWLEQENRSAPTTYHAAFPARFVFIEGEAEAPELDAYFGTGEEAGRYIVLQTGLDRGGEYTRTLHRPWEVPGEQEPLQFRYLALGGDAEVVLDYLVVVPSSDAALQVYLRNTQQRYGNGAIGRLYVNGRVVRSHDFGPMENPDWQEGMDPTLKRTWDTHIHGWRVPLGHMAGQPVLISIATDARGENNADELWWSRPKFVRDPAQQPVFVVYTDQAEIPEQQR